MGVLLSGEDDASRSRYVSLKVDANNSLDRMTTVGLSAPTVRVLLVLVLVGFTGPGCYPVYSVLLLFLLLPYSRSGLLLYSSRALRMLISPAISSQISPTLLTLLLSSPLLPSPHHPTPSLPPMWRGYAQAASGAACLRSFPILC